MKFPKRIVTAIFAAMVLAGCTSLPSSKQARESLVRTAQSSREIWFKSDPKVDAFVRKGYGYAYFPEIAKGGLVLGGAGGNGVVYEQGRHIGYAELTETSVGLQAGGQKFSQVIVFENRAALDRFRAGNLNFGANASAVITTKGAGANADFVDGVAVFIRPISGVMAEASLGGQNIRFIPR